MKSSKLPLPTWFRMNISTHFGYNAIFWQAFNHPAPKTGLWHPESQFRHMLCAIHYVRRAKAPPLTGQPTTDVLACRPDEGQGRAAWTTSKAAFSYLAFGPSEHLFRYQAARSKTSGAAVPSAASSVKTKLAMVGTGYPGVPFTVSAKAPA